MRLRNVVLSCSVILGDKGSNRKCEQWLVLSLDRYLWEKMMKSVIEALEINSALRKPGDEAILSYDFPGGWERGNVRRSILSVSMIFIPHRNSSGI